MPGGGGGSIQAMLTSLRNNANLLRKKTFFLREDGSELSRSEHKEALKFPEASAELLQEIKIKHAMRKKRIGYLALLIVVCTVGFSLYMAIRVSPKLKSEIPHKTKAVVNMNQSRVDKKRRYLNFIRNGDTWYTQSQFKNAVNQYKEALNLYPNSDAVYQRLSNTYALACEREGLFCEEWKNNLKKK